MKSIFCHPIYLSWTQDCKHWYARPGLVAACAIFCTGFILENLTFWAQLVFALIGVVFPPRIAMVWVFAVLLTGLRGPAPPPPEPNISLPENLQGMVVDAWPAAKGWRLDVKTPWGVVRSFVDHEQGLFLPGDVVQLSMQYRPIPTIHTSGGFSLKSYLQNHQLVAMGKSDQSILLDSYEHWQRPFFHLRLYLRKTLGKYLDSTATEICMALLVGEKARLPKEMVEDFRITGLLHVLSISGFHVALLAGCILLCLQFLRLGPRNSRLFALFLLLLYIPLAGQGASVQRAVLVFALLQVGYCLRLVVDSLNILGWVASLVLLLQPQLALQPGFQLSFAAAFFIIYLQRSLATSAPHNHQPTWWKKLVWEPLAVSLWATIGTAPILAWHFQGFSLWGLLGNLVVIPAIALCMISTLLLLLSSSVPPIAECYAASVHFFLNVAGLTAKYLAQIPGVEVLTGNTHPATSFGLWILALLVPPLKSGSTWARFSVRFILLFYCSLFCFTAILNAINPTVQISFLDAGQGDSTLLEFSRGKNILIDAGNPRRDQVNFGRNILLPYLRSRAINKLDALVITHPHLDHYGAAKQVLEKLKVGMLVVPHSSLSDSKNSWQEILHIARSKNIPILGADAGMHLAGLQPNYLRILHPQSGWGRNNINAKSLVLRLETPETCVLFMADTEIPEEKIIMQSYGSKLRCNLLKVGHHGSGAATGIDFLKVVRPELAIISAGRQSQFGHPHPATLERLQSLGIAVHNTALHGDLQIKTRRFKQLEF